MNIIRHVLETKGHDVYTTTAGAMIDDAVVEMCRRRVGALLVVDRVGQPVGILSERDLLTRVLLAHRDPSTTAVDDVMTREIVCIEEDDTISDAMEVMTRARCRHLPVVSDTVVGMVSIGDLVRVMHGDQEHELQALHDYVEGRYPG